MVLGRAFSADHFIGRKRQEAEAKSAFWIPGNTPKREGRGSIILSDPTVMTGRGGGGPFFLLRPDNQRGPLCFHVLAPGKTLVFGQPCAGDGMGALLHKPGGLPATRPWIMIQFVMPLLIVPATRTHHLKISAWVSKD